MRRSITAVLTLLLASACSAGTGRTVPSQQSATATMSATAGPASPSPAVSPPPGTTAMRDGSLKPGQTYVTPHFAAPFTIVVPKRTPSGFWFATSTTLSRVIFIGHPESEGAGVEIDLPTGGFTTDGTPAAEPDDFIAWLEDDPQISASKPRSTKVGGFDATQIDVAAVADKIPTPPSLCPAHVQCVLVASTQPDAPLRPLIVYPGLAQRIIVVDLPQGQLLIDIQPDVAVRGPAEQLIGSLTFL